MSNISLDKMGRGALLEEVNREFDKLTANVYDPNTSAKAKRSITIRLEFAPGEDRQMSDNTFSVVSSLCPSKGGTFRTSFAYDPVTRKGGAAEFDAEVLGQVDMTAVLAAHAEKLAEQEAEMERKVVDFRK